MVLKNLLAAEPDGPVWPINPRYDHIGPYPCYRSVAALPGVPDLGVIAVPAAAVPAVVEEFGEKGTRAVVIVTAGFHKDEGDYGAQLDAAAKKYGIRVVGPNCIGMIVPSTGVNASFVHITPNDGDLAFLSQSGALVAGVVDWAKNHGLGFRAVVSLGDMMDVDIADMLDYFASDAKTRAILVYMESINDARSFMSAARVAARAKPVVAIKSGRTASAAEAAASHTGALAASDIVFEAALRRAGVLRAYSLSELFTGAETVGHVKPFHGKRLAIVTNGGGAGVLAVDALEDVGELAKLAPETLESLNSSLPAHWSHGNPIDIIGDADAVRYHAAVDAALKDPNTDAVMIMNCPTALASNVDAVDASLKAWEENKRKKPIFGCWLGDPCAAEARHKLTEAGVPNFATPAPAIEGFGHMVRYSEVQELLMRTPPAIAAGKEPDRETAQKIVKAALDDGRPTLNADEAKAVLEAYDVPVAKAEVAETPDEVAALSARILETEKAVAVKIRSRDISHKSDVGGVRLGLQSADEARAAAEAILKRTSEVRPDAHIDGFTVEPIVQRKWGTELIAGVASDPLFGPILLFGAGGTAVEVLKDRVVGLPPLDMLIARDMIAETRVAKILAGYRDRPAADIEAIAQTLVTLSRLIVEVPEICELDINPLVADESGVVALDARIVAKPVDETENPRDRFAIRPYPQEWVARECTSAGLDVLLRPVLPEDEDLFVKFFEGLSVDDIRLRFFAPMKEFSHRFVARLTQIDYDRSMAFVALSPNGQEMLGVSHLILDADREVGEYAVIVRSDLKGKGLGWMLMQKLIEFARVEGVTTIIGDVLNANTTMLDMCRNLGFEVAAHNQDPSIRRVSLKVGTTIPEAQPAE